MAGLITTGSFAKDLLPGVNKWFGDAYGDLVPQYTDIFETVKSDRNFEEDVLSSGLGLAKQKVEGASLSYDSMSQGYTKRYIHTTYANGFIITREMLEDGQSDVIARQRARSLKHSMLSTKEVQGALILDRAFNSSFTGGDGKELCATDHPTRSTDLQNELTTAADLSEASLEQALIDISNYTDDRGLRIAAVARRLIVPRALGFEAERILATTLRPGVADNDINASKSLGMVPEGARMNHYMSDQDAWFLITDVPDGMKYMSRREMEMGTDNDFDTENAKFKATMRFSFGWTDPRGIFGTPGAA